MKRYSASGCHFTADAHEMTQLQRFSPVDTMNLKQISGLPEVVPEI